ncbi:MAG: alpha-glucosidase, partial [Oscillospiraceae bacterium]
MAQKNSVDWWKKSVVYQVYPRSFNDANGDGIGDLRGITQKLDYIKGLGADVIWISPFFSSPNDDNGYDISNYRDIMQEFGTMQDCEELLNTAHEKGLKIMIDLVVNHSSDEHEWFKQCKTDKAASTRDYYIWRDGKNGKEPNNWFAFFGGNAWEYEKETDQYYLHMFSKKQPDLNWENPKLRREVYDIMEFWIDKGADGFRMDVINMISKEPSMPDGPELFSTGLGIPIQYVCNGPRVHEYLQEMNREVLSKHDLITVGETPNTSVTDAEKYANVNGTELNMIFQFEHMMLDKAKPGEPYRPYDLVTLKQILSKWQTELQDKAWNSLYWNNHDQPRVVSRFGNDSTPEYRVKSAKMLATCLHMMCGTPFVYQGEELGMTNAVFGNISEINDIGSINTYKQYIASGVDAKEAMRVINITTRDNARTPMQWTDGENAG